MSNTDSPNPLHPYVVSDYYDGQPVLVLHPNDPAAGPALEAYRNALWRLYQRGEVPAYCADAGELLGLIDKVGAMCRQAKERRADAD